MFFIAFNHHNTTHNYSVTVLSEKGIYTFPIERYDRVKKSPRRVISFFGDIPGETVKKYYSKIIQEIYKIIPLGSDIITINLPDGIHFSKYNVIKKIKLYHHHYMHAASSYYASGYEDSCIINIDGFGNEDKTYGKYISQSIWKGKGKNIYKIAHEYHNKTQIGIGMTYSLISKQIIGYEAGSTMGLSSYGDYTRFNHVNIYENIDGLSSFLHPDFTKGINFSDDILFFYQNSFLELFKKNCKNIFGISNDDSQGDITKSIYADIAAKLQYDTEKAIISIAQKGYSSFPSKNLCLAGGSALNVIANTKILEKTPFKKIFVQPAATDDGLSLGAAYIGAHYINPNYIFPSFKNASLGKRYSPNEIKISIKKYENILSYSQEKNIESIVAQKICDGKIIAIFIGRSEFGPRALGNRSIIADASSKKLAEKVNDIKKREKWRPLAPMLLVEDLKAFFPKAKENYFMTSIGYANDDALIKIPGAIHIDKTARYQTLQKQQNKKMYNILKEVKKIKGNSVVINTSFNSRSEPIIESPEDAIKMFLSTNLDYLVIEDYIISKEKIYSEYTFCYEKNIVNLKDKLDVC